MDNDTKLLLEAYQKRIQKLDEVHWPSRGGGWATDGSIADAIVDRALRIAGQADRSKLTGKSKDLQQVFFDVDTLSKNG